MPVGFGRPLQANAPQVTHQYLNNTAHGQLDRNGRGLQRFRQGAVPTQTSRNGSQLTISSGISDCCLSQIETRNYVRRQRSCVALHTAGASHIAASLISTGDIPPGGRALRECRSGPTDVSGKHLFSSYGVTILDRIQ